MTCVCGHPKTQHRPHIMSVPLTPNPAPLYPMPSNCIIAVHRPNATYERVECGCGRCCEYLPDTGGD